MTRTADRATMDTSSTLGLTLGVTMLPEVHGDTTTIKSRGRRPETYMGTVGTLGISLEIDIPLRSSGMRQSSSIIPLREVIFLYDVDICQRLHC